MLQPSSGLTTRACGVTIVAGVGRQGKARTYAPRVPSDLAAPRPRTHHAEYLSRSWGHRADVLPAHTLEPPTYRLSLHRVGEPTDRSGKRSK